MKLLHNPTLATSVEFYRGMLAMHTIANPSQRRFHCSKLTVHSTIASIS